MRRKTASGLALLVFILAVTGCSGKISAGENAREAGQAQELGTGEVWVSFSYIDDASLKKYASYDSFIENEEHLKIAFTSNVPVKDFSWLAIAFSDEGYDEGFKIEEELYSLKELNPQKPFVVTWQEIGIFPHRGFSYRGENGQKRYYALMSGNYGADPEEYDGPDLVVSQFFPMRIVTGKYEYTPDDANLLLYLDTEASYALYVNDDFHEGTAVIEFENGRWFVTLDNIKWAHNWMKNFASITDYGALGDLDWDEMTDEETYGVILWMEEGEDGKELVFQNHGNPMAPYVIFDELGDKFIRLEKAP